MRSIGELTGKYRKHKVIYVLIWLIILGLWPIILSYWLYTKASFIKNKAVRVSAFVGVAVILLFGSIAWAAVIFGNQSTGSSHSKSSANTTSNLTETQNQQTTASQQPEPASSGIGTRTKTSGCVVSGALQDKACTPGAVFPGVTKAQICTSGHASSVRDASEETKNAVYAEYGIATHTTGQYEVDHLVSLELGGSNDIANLWPEAASPTPGFHQKDGVENELHDEVCNGTISLTTAQDEIASNWLAIYQGTTPSSSTPQTSAPAASQPSSSSGVVKLSATGICHVPGDAYYDRTTDYTPYNTLQDCLNAGGRLPAN